MQILLCLKSLACADTALALAQAAARRAAHTGHVAKLEALPCEVVEWVANDVVGLVANHQRTQKR